MRAQPGSFGLCTANGHNVTKHSAGIYSTTPTEAAWQRENPASYQVELDAMPKPAELERLAEPWRPYRSVGSWYLWRATETITPE